MFQQTGSRGNASAFGGTGAFDTDRFYLSDAIFKELFPGAANGEIPGECPDDCKELIQALMSMIEATNHKVLNLEQQIALLVPIIDNHATKIIEQGERISSVARILKAIAEVINQEA